MAFGHTAVPQCSMKAAPPGIRPIERTSVAHADVPIWAGCCGLRVWP